MKNRSLIIIAILIYTLQSCILFKKEITKPVVVKIIQPGNFAYIKQTANYVKYANAFNETDYETAFANSLTGEGKLTHNVTIDNNAVTPDFIIEIKNIEISESDFTQTVNDPKSEFNGKQFLLNKIEVSALVDCIDGKTNKRVGLSCSNIKSKQEKLKNNRDLGDLISGTNKDHSTYRQKTLNDNIAKQLTEDVGRRIWVPISKRIKKSLK